MSLVLVHGGRKRVIRVGRFAGQYAKPRSDDREVKDGVSLPSYRGDIINHAPFTLEARTPDPELLLRGYERAALTVNFIRALIDGGFADLHHPEYWDLDFVRHSPLAAGISAWWRRSGTRSASWRPGRGADKPWPDRFLHQPRGAAPAHEQAQTRRVPHRTGWYSLASTSVDRGTHGRPGRGAHRVHARHRQPAGH